jgi:hypothetical protein
MEAPYRRLIVQSVLARIRAWLESLKDDPALLDDDGAALPADYAALKAVHGMFTRSLLMGIEAAAAGKKKSGGDFADLLLSDMPLEALPFEEAIAFLQTQIPLTKKAYYALDDRLRLRSFTVGRLTDGDAVNRVKGILRRNLEAGGTIADFYHMTDDEILDGAGFGRGNMSYWETVYRTNQDTLHNAGRAMGFEADPPLALELLGVNDERQTETCRTLTQPPFIRPYNDPVWKKLWPPFHFSCRTYVRGIYDGAELNEYGGPEAAYARGTYAEPEKGFGAYPLDKESYWRLTPEMAERAGKYGIDGEIAVAAVKLGMKNYALELVKDYKTIHVTASGGGYVKQARNSIHTEREISLAKKAADDGHQIYLLPENKATANPDMIIDGEVGEIKQPVSDKPGRIDEDIRDAGHKGATVALMEVRDDLPKETIDSTIKKRMRRGMVNKAIVYWRGGFFVVVKN